MDSDRWNRVLGIETQVARGMVLEGYESTASEGSDSSTVVHHDSQFPQ